MSKVSHPLPAIFQLKIAQSGHVRLLRDELVHEYQSSLFRGSTRAWLRLLFSMHPRDAGYGGTVSFMQQDDPTVLEQVGAPVAQGIWEALAEFALRDFALVVQEVEVALSGDASGLLHELANRAVRDALHEATLATERLPGWRPPEQAEEGQVVPPEQEKWRASRYDLTPRWEPERNAPDRPARGEKGGARRRDGRDGNSPRSERDPKGAGGRPPRRGGGEG